MINRFCLAMLVAVSASCALAANDTPLAMDPKVTVGKLPNGLTYYIRENKKPEKRMELRLAVNAGSVLEDDDQQGIAHLCEHMAFNGTKHFPKQDLVNTLEKMGVNFGADLNAYTSFDETVYMLQVPTDQQDLMEKGMQVMEDWAHLCSYDGDEIDKERGVVIEEWRLGRGAGQRMQDKEFPVLFNGSRYATRIPIGKKEILESTPQDRVRQFYKDWYRPDLMALIVVGDFDAAKIEAMVKEHFGSIPARADEKPRTQFAVPGNDAPLSVVATDKEASETDVSLLFKYPPHVVRTVADFRRNQINSLVTDMLSERLRELTEQADPPFTGAFVYKGDFVRASEVMAIQATVKDNGAQRGLDALVLEAGRVKQHGFTATELERRKTMVLRSAEKRYNERDKMESGRIIGQYVAGFLRGNPTISEEREYALEKEIVPTITLDEVNAAANALITEQNRVVSAEAPEKDGVPVPTAAELLHVLNTASAKPVAAYVDKVSDKPLVPQKPAAGTIVNTKTRDDIGTTEWTLSNGVHVVMKPTDFKNDEVLFAASARGGHSVAPDADFIPAEIADEVISDCGAGAFDPAELRKTLAGKIAQAGVSIDETHNRVKGNASPKDLQTMFELIYLRMTAPRMDSVQFAAHLARKRSELENRSADPQAAWSDTIAVTMGNYNPRRMPPTIAMLDKYDLRKSYDFYRKCFGDASGFTFYFVGNFTIDGIKPLVLTYLGGLPSTHGSPNWRDLNIEPPAGKIDKTVRKGLDQKSLVLADFHGPFTWAPKERHDLNAACEAISIRLREVLREDKSGVYFVFLSPQMEHQPRDKYDATMVFGCSPDRADELLKTAYEIIDSIRDHGISSTYAEKVSEQELREREVNVKQNSFWLGALQTYMDNGDDPGKILEYPSWAKAITPQVIQTAAQKYLTRANTACFVLRPDK